MSLSLKISNNSNFSIDGFNVVDNLKQCRASQRLELGSICFRIRCSVNEPRRIHWSSKLSSPKSRTRCLRSDVVAGEISGRSVPEWTYIGVKDETLSDLEPDLGGYDGDGDGDDDGNGNSGNGGDGGGGGGDGGDEGEEEAEEKEFGPILRFEEVIKETERRGITLPEDMLEAARSIGLRKLFLFRYIDLQGSVWPLGFLMRTCSMLRNRMLADPSFLFKVGTEIAIDSCCATFAEVQKRGEDFWSEFELYAADLLVGLAVWLDFWLPMLVSGSHPWLRQVYLKTLSALVHHFLAAERPGCKFSVNQRIATFFYKGLLYGSVGFGCGLIGQGIANIIMTAKRSIKKSEEDVPVPPLFESAALWGVFLGLSSNARYQIINGLERVVEGSSAAKRVPVVAMAFTVGVRFANNVYGGMQFVDWAKLSGVQ
ncbi:unnamed protein product [Cochlearia groenlandica]